MEYEFSTKDELLGKLRSYTTTPDDDNIRIKEKIKQLLLHTPELLYAFNEPELEKELFDENGNLNVDENGEPLGEWDRYFGDNSNIRPYLFFPEVQTEMKTYLCYQVQFTEAPRNNSIEKYCQIVFTCFVYGTNNIPKEIGIPRHDLIMSIIREKFAWTNEFGQQFKLISDKESTTDNNYVVRTVIYQGTILNSIVNTKNGNTKVINTGVNKANGRFT